MRKKKQNYICTNWSLTKIRDSEAARQGRLTHHPEGKKGRAARASEEVGRSQRGRRWVSQGPPAMHKSVSGRKVMSGTSSLPGTGPYLHSLRQLRGK